MSDNSSINEPDFENKFYDEWEKLKKEHPKPLILVTGGTGAGKSTLINLVLGKPMAVTGAGRPVTQKMQLFENDLIALYDSKGYENGEKAQEEFFDEIRNFITDKQNSPQTSINIVWHCVSAPSARFLDVDANLLRLYSKFGIPSALVFTQVDSADEDQIRNLEKVAKESISPLEVFLSTSDAELCLKIPHNLADLYEWSLKHMEIAKRAAFRAACNRNLDEKRIRGHKIAAQHATAAFGVGFSPIPFSDAPLLIADQMGMVARIGFLWGMDLGPMITTGVLSQAMSILGKSAAANLLKFFPGIGTVIGGMINGTVGAGLTYALGAALNEICHHVCKLQLDGESVPYDDLFSSEALIEAMRQIIKGYKGKKPWEGEA